jgi:hypothetical protein
VGIVALVALAALTLAVTFLVVTPRIGNLVAGAHGIHDADALAAHIRLCGRSWSKDDLMRRRSSSEIREQLGVEPVIVDPGPFAVCPAGPCTDVAQAAACHTVIWVRVGEDAYIGYELQGGP